LKWPGAQWPFAEGFRMRAQRQRGQPGQHDHFFLTKHWGHCEPSEDTVSKAQDYPLGYSAEEAQRLADQGVQVEELTEDVFRRAGLRRGMQVLDIGSGVGDVSLLAARMVGSDGAVLGIDKASSSVEIARRRVAALGVQNVHFEESDLAAFASNKKFDAIVGRFVLLYVPDQATTLRSLTRHLRPGGIVALQELDISQISEAPPSALFTQARRWLLEAFAAGGAELDMGTKLYATFLHAGLPAPTMIAATPVACGPASPGYEDMVRVLRSMLPLIERSGIATTAEIGIDTLAERLREDAVANNRVIFLSRIVGAWARLT
jgi:2-polyprenyl-3-methyl-5-hydroxy-6-metoxy-1,4-benzoquinol methylase